MEFQFSQSIWKIILSIVITAVIFGGGIYLWQKAQIDALHQEIQDLQAQNEKITDEKRVLEKELAESVVRFDTKPIETVETRIDSNYKTSALCTDVPILTDIGRDVYPVDPKYGGLGFIGQLFTAYNCGTTRVNKIFGVDGDNYTLGSTVWLKINPRQSLVDVFKFIGFKCGEGILDVSCKKWELEDTVPINDLMKLEPYHENFEADDCINCG